MSSIQLQQKEKTSQLLWTGFILSFFLIQAVIWSVAITLTASDSSHAVVAGYDEQALKWDEIRAQQLASDSLGWQPALNVAAEADIRGNRLVTLKLFNEVGQAVTGAAIEIQAFHRGQAAQVQQIQLAETDSGSYAGMVQVRKAGNWQFNGTATRDGKQLLIEERAYINLAKAN